MKVEFTRSHLLNVPRCPHCSVAAPTFVVVWISDSPTKGEPQRRNKNIIGRMWGQYRCTTCGNHVLVRSLEILSDGVRTLNPKDAGIVDDIYPSVRQVDDDIPTRARSYLAQALEAMHAPDGAVMLAASAVDAMLKAKGFSDGSLYRRIELAVSNNVITADMGIWAHRVRLDANDVRHADDEFDGYSRSEAEQIVQFAEALGQFLFVLPARVAAGINATEEVS